MVARWRFGAFRVVGLEFVRGASQVDAAKLAPHLANFEYLEFVKLPQPTAAEAAKWRKHLPQRYAVVHCGDES